MPVSVVFGRDVYEAGTAVEVVVRVDPARRADVAVLWRAQGTLVGKEAGWERTGDLTEEEVVHRARVEEGVGEQSLSFGLPALPVSFVGQLFAVEWVLRVEALGEEAREFPFRVT